MSNTHRMRAFILTLFLSLSLVTSMPVYAADTHTTTSGQDKAAGKCDSTDPNCYVLLAPLPLTNPSAPESPVGATDPSSYIQGILKLSVAVAGGIAVVMIMIGGFQYITTENFGKKGTARDTIKNAVLSLNLVIGAFTILYTINPTLEDLGLIISPTRQPGAIDAQGICAGPVDRNGLCIAVSTTTQSTDNNGNPISINCNRCLNFKKTDFPQKDPGAGCKSPGPCMVEDLLGDKLRALNTQMSKTGLSWWVTEMWPPTVWHKDDCHRSGTCVDATMMGITDPKSIVGFMYAIHKAGLSSFQWEVTGSTKEFCESAAIQLKSQINDYALHFLQTDPDGNPVTAGSSELKAVSADLQKHVVCNPPATTGGGTLVGGAHMHINSPDK